MDFNIKDHIFNSPVCYICECAVNDELRPITEDIMKEYRFVSEINVLLNEISQLNMCRACILNITKFAQFKRKCVKSYSFWKKYIEKQNLKQENITEINVKNEILSDVDNNTNSEYSNGIKVEEVKIENRIKNHLENDKELKNEKIPNKISRKFINRQCEKCKKNFSYKKSYLGHIKMCGNIAKELKPPWKNSVAILNPEKCTYCGHCNITFKDLRSLKNHLDSLKEEVQCTLCEFKAIDYAMLIAHRYSHLPENYTIFCHTCGKTFYVRLGLEYHYRSVHSHENANICLRCDKEFSCYRMWRRHVLHHEWRYQCDKCNARFWHKFDIIEHVKGHMYGHRYICDVCGYSTARMNNLRSHKDASHTTYERVKCDICYITLKNERSLIRHRKMQHVVNVCCTVCGKGFSNNNALKLHMVWHDDARPHKCDTCCKAFKVKAALQNHLRTHTGEKLHECGVCHIRFSSSSSLKRHKKLHAKKNDF